MKVNKISILDKFGLMIRTFKKNFYYTYNHKLNLSYSKKIKKLILKRDQLDKKIFNKYLHEKSKYDKYIAYLQFKDLNNEKNKNYNK